MELAKNCFIRTLGLRIKNYLYHVKGKQDGECVWNYILVDWDKKDQFLEINETDEEVDILKYGKILDSGWGHDIPKSVQDHPLKFVDYLLESFFLFRFETDGCLQIYYVLANIGKELEMKAASSVEDVRRCGAILYTSFDEDPPEALAYILEAKYFGLHSEINWDVDSPFDAVLIGELQNVLEYLNSGMDVNCTDGRGWTLLHHFAHKGIMDSLVFLKSKGADFQIRDKICGRKPVLIAAREGHIKVIEFFLKNGATVNETDDNNWSLLHYAAYKGNVETVKLLIENHADVNAKELTMGKKPIHIAAEYGHTDVVEILDNYVGIEDEDDFGRTPLFYAAVMGNLETAEFLIVKGADIIKNNKFDTMPIHAAVAFNSKEVIDLFLNLGVNVDESDGRGNTPLHYAVMHGHLDLVRFLIDKKADPNIGNNSGLKPIDFCKENTDIFLYLTDKMV